MKNNSGTGRKNGTIWMSYNYTYHDKCWNLFCTTTIEDLWLESYIHLSIRHISLKKNTPTVIEGTTIDDLYA